MFLAGLLIGYMHRDLLELVKKIKIAPVSKSEESKEEPRSMIVEALTPEQVAQREFQERVKRLNS